jgi:predicted Zn-dependent peptidase
MQHSRLSNGLLVATDVVPGARSVAAGVWVGVGARDEPSPLAGVSHLLEHLVFKGTRGRSAQDIARSVDRCGGDLNAFTTHEYTAFHGRMPLAAQPLLMDLLGDLLTKPLLAPGDVSSERQVVLEELAMDDDSPDDVAHRALARSLFDPHALGRNTAGDRSTVAALTPEAVRSFFERWYRTSTCVVAVAGPVDHAEVVAQAERAFAELAGGGARPERGAPAPLVGTGSEMYPDDSEQVHLVWGWRGVSRTDPDREALDVVNHVLGGGLSSRLFDEIRERRGLAYSVFSGTARYVDCGSVTVYAGTLPDHVEEVMEVVDREVASLVAHGITDDELDIAIGYLTGSYELGLDDPGARMARLGGALITMGEVITVEEQLRRWRAVDHDAVRRVLARVLEQPHRLVAVGPVRGNMIG